MPGASVWIPAPRRWAAQAALGGNHKIGWIGVEGFADQSLADLGAVRVGCIDEVHAQTERFPQRGLGLVPAWRLSPDAPPGNPHRPEAEPVHRPIAPDGDRARLGRIRLAIHSAPPPSVWYPPATLYGQISAWPPGISCTDRRHCRRGVVRWSWSCWRSLTARTLRRSRLGSRP